METVIVVLAVLVAIAAVGHAFFVRRRAAETEILSARPESASPGTELSNPPEMVVLEAPDGSDSMVGMAVPASSAALFGPGAPADVVSGTPIAWDRAIQAVPTLAGALSRGEVVRIVGPEHLVAGLRSGELKEVFSQGGFLGVVKADDGKWAGHLRFEAGESARVPASVAGPLLLFQLASAVTMQYYLHQITTRLASIQEGVESVKTTLRAKSQAKTETAAKICTNLEAVVDRGLPLNQDDRRELQSAYDLVSESYHEQLKILATFNAKVEQQVDEDGELTVSPKTLRPLLDEGGGDAAVAAMSYLEALVVRLRVLRIKSLAAVDAEPQRASAISSNVEREIDEMRREFDNCSTPFDRLNVRRSEVSKFALGAEEELDQYRTATRSLRATLRTPVRRVLPPPGAPEPFVVEMLQGPDGVQVRQGLLTERAK